MKASQKRSFIGILKGPREIYNDLLNDKSEIDRILKDGGDRAREIASVTMERVRKSITGF